ncbi:uncharacterized protein M421DRAFT_92785 [Didymella exigua CBS 183.55]|uniref:Uncharacterized protein n=1 Tax=Didymella exigua CBS 183.55 TaxID=1150837 RepID=A0A6A5RLF6_9PLEO|nr:uncharacterized protein M421DRAFT_92785 [Didymella exigua CBS 183.55]KAF1927938.1 hypothetical protein M421DRAFT_92785 [Didymella exigua CBS 183.55]
MCVITILHCTPCKSRQDIPEEGLIITRDWHARLLVNLDNDNIPFKRCIDAINHALSNGRSDTMYPRCRNVEVKHMAVTKDICFRCSARQKIQNFTNMRKLYEKQSVAWRNEERSNIEAVNDMRSLIRESPRLIPVTERDRASCTTVGFLTARLAPVTPVTESWEYCLERQIQQRELAKRKEAEKAEDKLKKAKRKQARLISVQQCLARANRLRHTSAMEENAEQSSASRSEQVSRPGSLQDVPASHNELSPAADTRVLSGSPSWNTFVRKFHTTGRTSAIQTDLSGKDHSTDATMRPVAGSAWVRVFFSLRGDAPEFASLRGCPSSLKGGSLRAEAPEFRPLRETPPTEPRMMRAPSAPRAMREGCLRPASTQPRQMYSTVRGYPTLRGWRQ